MKRISFLSQTVVEIFSLYSGRATFGSPRIFFSRGWSRQQFFCRRPECVPVGVYIHHRFSGERQWLWPRSKNPNIGSYKLLLENMASLTQDSYRILLDTGIYANTRKSVSFRLCPTTNQSECITEPDDAFYPPSGRVLLHCSQCSPVNCPSNELNQWNSMWRRRALCKDDGEHRECSDNK